MNWIEALFFGFVMIDMIFFMWIWSLEERLEGARLSILLLEEEKEKE